MDVIKRHALAAAIAEIEDTGQHRQDQRTAPAPIDEDAGTRSTEASMLEPAIPGKKKKKT
jgi:hypothetical protein